MANEYQLLPRIRQIIDLAFEERALRAYHQEYLPLAIRKFRYDIDKNNNVYAKYMLARIYRVGAGLIAKDIDSALELAGAAAENNVVDAMEFLLDIYCCRKSPEDLRYGKYVISNHRGEYIALRLKLLLQASGEYGAVASRAMNELWSIHTSEKDYSRWKTTLKDILRCYREDAMTNSISDSVKLGQIYLRLALWNMKNNEEGHSIDDNALVSLYLEQAGEYGQVAAYSIIGHEIYRKGLGVSRDLDTAFLYVKRAADAGHELALRKLCHFPEYRFKLSTEDRINYLLKHAIQAYNIKSLYELGVELYRGVKITRDYELGLGCFKLAATASIILPKDAKLTSDKVYGISSNSNDDITWLTLGLCYKFGISREKDYNRALTCYYLGLFSTLYSGDLIYQSTLGCLSEIGKVFENRNAELHNNVKAIRCYKLVIQLCNVLNNENGIDNNYGTYWAYANYRLLKLSRKMKDSIEIPDLEIVRKAVQTGTDRKGLLSGYHKGIICEYGFIQQPNLYLAYKYYVLATSKLMKNPNLDDKDYATGFPAIHDDILRKKAYIRRKHLNYLENCFSIIIRNLPEKISWADFASGLGFSKPEIATLSTRYTKVINDEKIMIRKILEEWKYRCGKNVSMNDVVTYMEKEELMYIAEQIKCCRP
ncbi:hypothetical protein TrispH2_001169 [Trichoplax sp. H2]|nr:hypothetical protein TrispH2_001169 [Trichoplax sp. H2]|eukprot:RDD46736.1 hypothetical protein TrispH2_001169 [Trichoplax sp. H2]